MKTMDTSVHLVFTSCCHKENQGNRQESFIFVTAKHLMVKGESMWPMIKQKAAQAVGGGAVFGLRMK